MRDVIFSDVLFPIPDKWQRNLFSLLLHRLVNRVCQENSCVDQSSSLTTKRTKALAGDDFLSFLDVLSCSLNRHPLDNISLASEGHSNFK